MIDWFSGKYFDFPNNIKQLEKVKIMDIFNPIILVKDKYK